MASGSIDISAKPSTNLLRDELNAALPSGFNAKLRYIRSPSKACEPLFSALPGQEPEKTRLASHFLTVSVNPSSLFNVDDASTKDKGIDVISFAIEVLVYSTKRLTTLFVSKVDSTPFIPRIKPSPIKTTITTILRWLAKQERRRHPKRKIVLSLFARAQAQYLFPGSSDDKTKHVLDDRQLIKWWAKVLDPIIETNADKTSVDLQTRYQGYLTVPGYAKTELRSFMPPGSAVGQTPRWLPGNPLIELARTRGVPEYAPPRCLLPRFPDDPKARYMQDLDEEIGIAQDSAVTVSPSKKKSGRWKSVFDLDRFWEAMEFRQECSSGRAVGFLWLVISPPGSDEEVELDGVSATQIDSQDSAMSISTPPTSSEPVVREEVSKPTTSSPRKRKRKPLTGLIVARQPRLKGGSSSLSNLGDMVDAEAGGGIVVSKEGYDKAIDTLLHLDFSSLKIATKSTTKWISEVKGIAALNSDLAVEVTGTANVEAAAAATTATNGTAGVNDLGGMVRKKKRKADDGDYSSTAEIQPVVDGTTAAVNVLGGGMIRKKPKK